MDRLGKAVQRVTHDGRLDELQVHRLIGDRLPEDRMRRRIRRQNGERSSLHHLVMQNVRAVANRADAVQLGDAVSILIHADIAFDVEHFVRRLVSRLRDAEERLVCRVANDDFLVHLEPASASVHLDHVAVVSHRHKIGDGHQTTTANVDRVLNGHSFVVDEELFRRYALDNVARRALDAANGHRDDLLTSQQVGFLGVHINFDILVLRDQARFSDREAGIVEILDALVVQLVPVQDAGLQDQGVLDGIVQNTKPGVLLHEDVVDEVGCLLGSRHIFSVLRDKLQNLVAARENTEQRRKHRQNGVTHLGHHDLRAAILLVSEQVAEVIRHRLLTLGRNIAVDVRLAVLNRLIDDVSELLVAHGLGVRRQIACF